MKERASGYTLVELIIVVIILGILASVAIPRFTGLVDNEKLKEAETILKAIRTAERFYYLGPGSGGYTSDLNALKLDQGSINASEFTFSTFGTPVSGARANDGTSDVREIDFDSGDISIP